MEENKVYARLQQLRDVGDYNCVIDVDKEDVEDFIEPTRALIEKIKKFIAEKQAQFVVLTNELEEATAKAALIEDNQEKAYAYRNEVFAKMEALRELGDSMEAETAADYWPYPSYTDLLFGV